MLKDIIDFIAFEFGEDSPFTFVGKIVMFPFWLAVFMAFLFIWAFEVVLDGGSWIFTRLLLKKSERTPTETADDSTL